MELRQHFELYRGKIKEDILDGLIEFTQKLPTRTPDKFPTAFDLMKFCISDIQKHIKFSDIYNYKRVIRVHQRSMITALELYVDSFLKEYIEMYGLSNDLIKDFIVEKGWPWFKFCRHNFIHNEKTLIVPRYYTADLCIREIDDTSRLVYDTDELLLYQAYKVNPIGGKEEGEKILGFQDNISIKAPITDINGNWGINDWTAPLFPET